MLLTLLFNDIHSLLTPENLEDLDIPTLHNRANFFLLFRSPHIFYMQVFAIIILILVISGYFIQLTSLLHFWIAASFYFIKPLNLGGDNINMLLTLLLIPVCLFDKRKNHWNRVVLDEGLHMWIQNIFLIIIKLQVAYIYLDAVFRKLQVREWRNGTMIYYWFTHNFFGLDAAYSNVTTPLLNNTTVLLVMAWGTILIELLIIVGIFFSPRYKLIFLKLAIIFHLFILLVYGFSSFFFAISGALFLYLYPSQKSFKPSFKNEFALFYLYLILVLILANILPVSGRNNTINILLVLGGIVLLFLPMKENKIHRSYSSPT
jgi:antimicrobial peptide system SdpB family protein